MRLEAPICRHRTGLFRLIGDVMDDVKLFTDDCLDRAAGLEHDLRRAVSDAVRPEKNTGNKAATTVPAGRTATGRPGAGKPGRAVG
ncbi:hypothetical protein [Streptomyces sp. I05A-00742]|uniref:hypothetical protein n=1 Tax=Streptomyces sp. I05A-00742 TaxID=2732853 RepID=UPI0020174972|nr:hypothetical protein [Streptomyces sp. I05A-00742]